MQSGKKMFLNTEISPEVLQISQGLAKNSDTAILALSVQAQVYSQEMVDQVWSKSFILSTGLWAHFISWAMRCVCIRDWRICRVFGFMTGAFEVVSFLNKGWCHAIGHELWEHHFNVNARSSTTKLSIFLWHIKFILLAICVLFHIHDACWQRRFDKSALYVTKL